MAVVHQNLKGRENTLTDPWVSTSKSVSDSAKNVNQLENNTTPQVTEILQDSKTEELTISKGDNSELSIPKDAKTNARNDNNAKGLDETQSSKVAEDLRQNSNVKLPDKGNSNTEISGSKTLNNEPYKIPTLNNGKELSKDELNSDNESKVEKPGGPDENGNGNLDDLSPLNEDDLDEYDPDLFLTDEEKQAFDFMITQRREELVTRKEKFEKWVDSITRRRMFALSRMRKIKISQNSRIKFYNRIDDYIEQANQKLQGKSSTQATTNNNQSTPTATPKTSNKALENSPQSGNLDREDTGFVVRDNDQNANSKNIEMQGDQKLPLIVPVPS